MNKNFLAIMSVQILILETLLKISKGEKLTEEEEKAIKKICDEVHDQLFWNGF